MALAGGVDEEETLAPTCLRLLVIDASASSRTALCALLKQCSYEVRTLGSLKGGRARLSARALCMATGAGEPQEPTSGRRSQPCRPPPRLCTC